MIATNTISHVIWTNRSSCLQKRYSKHFIYSSLLLILLIFSILSSAISVQLNSRYSTMQAPITLLCLVMCAIVWTPQGTDASCESKQKNCDFSWAPVCATLTKTYDNSCHMEADLCGLAKQGFHFVESKKTVSCCKDVHVPSVRRPTCGSDGNTYANPQAMKAAACKNQDYIVKAPSHTCQGFPEVSKCCG